MKLTKKEYITREEKRKDFFIGVGIFIGLNVLLSILLTLLSLAFMYLRLPSDTQSAVSIGLSCMTYPLQFLANAGVIVYFALTRSWIALGMVATFAFLILLTVIAGIVLSVFCLATLNP